MDFIPLSLSDHARADKPVPPLAPSDYPLRLEMDWERGRSSKRTVAVISASVLLHALAFVLALQLPSLVQPNLPGRVVVQHKTPLYFPQELTQKAKNKNKVSKEIDLASLVASQENQQQQRASPNASVRHFEPPTKVGMAEANKTSPRIMPDAPTLSMNQSPDVSAGALNGLTPAPPPPNAKSSPLAAAGAQAPPKPVQQPRTPPPPGSLRPGVSNENQSVPEPALPGLNGQLGNMHPSIELLSNPQGADFKPYLERVLAIVRANWQRVIPEAVRQNRMHGRSVLQFVINRDGSIARVIVAEPSGVNQLDFAASSSLVMSSPLPQLPAEFKGYQVRLAFTFTYAMPVQ